MRVGLLAYSSLERPNGVNRYVRALLDELPDVELLRRTSRNGAHHRRLRRALDRVSLRGVGLPGPSPQLDGIDIAHIPYERIDTAIPVRQLRERSVVATVMGLGGLSGANPEPSAIRLDTAFVEAMQRLDAVAYITPTESTRRVLCEAIGVDESTVTVIPLGVDHQIFTPTAPATRCAYRPTERPYLLHVGPYSVRKNSRLLLEAFADSCRQDSLPHMLVWAGPVDPTPLLADADRLGVTDRIVIAGPLADEALADAYRGASLVCIPSRYEGFGLPLVEAMACGTPVLTSDSPALVEIGGEAASIVSTIDGPDDLAAEIGRLLESDAARTEMRIRGLEHAARFSWAKCASQHAEHYRRVAGRPPDRTDQYSPPLR